MIYETRPDICRVDKICPTGMDMKEHFDRVEHYCDKVHREVYGVERERNEDCDHKRAELRLQFETTSTCNAACHFCVYPVVASMRRGQLMDMDLFKKIVDEAATIPHIAIYSMQGLGEPLLDPDIANRIAYIKKKDPNAKTELFTNGVPATPARLIALNNAGLDCIVFSLNAVREDQHEKVMGVKGQFKRVCANIEEAAKLPRWVVRVHAVEDGKNFTVEDSLTLRKRWGDLCKPVGVGNWGADLPFNYSDFKPNERCNRALDGIYVMWNGQVTMCCFDPLGEGAIFGDLNQNTLKQIYASKRYVQFREDHFNDKADRHERCAGCSRI
jgi:sulfatase maturation enzyme AslB (radical SAM superfamily)